MSENTQQLLEKDLNLIINFFKQKDLSLSYIPSIGLIPESVFKTDMISSVKVVNHNVNYLDGLINSFNKELFEEIFDESAAEQFSNYLSVDVSKQFNFVDNDYFKKDVAVYENYFLSNTKTKKIALAHEYWHLIEMENKVFKDFSLINEGTATYAALKINNYSTHTSSDSLTNLKSVVYFGVSNVIDTFMTKHDLDLKDLLDVLVRQEISSIFERNMNIFKRDLKNNFVSIFRNNSFDYFIEELNKFNNSPSLNIYSDKYAPSQKDDFCILP